MLRQALAGFVAVWLCSVVLLVPAHAEPRINNISPRGLQIGGTTTVVVEGADLLPDAKLLLPFPAAQQTLRAGGTPQRVEIEVTLDDAAVPGIVPVRVASGKGVSNQMALGVDRLPQLAFAPEIAGPAALSGNLGAGEIMRTSFTATKGSTWIVDVEAQRLGSGLRPAVRLFDERGTQVAWSPPTRRLDGDARFQHTFAADGRYTVELHEPLYRGANPPFFRLKLGPLQCADTSLPLAVAAGTKTSIELVGGNVTSAAEHDASAVVAPGYAAVTLPPGSEQYTGPAPSIWIADHPEILEATPPSGQPGQLLGGAPIGVSGRLATTGEEDVYLLPVTPGQKLNFEVFAQRLNSPVDGVLSIRNAEGNQLAMSDDRPGTSDPGLDFTVPAGVTQLQIAVKDLKGAGGSDHVYRLAVKDAAAPDFSLSLDIDHLSIPAGGTQILPVKVNRMGYDGPIEISLDGLPPEVQLTGTHIPAGATIGLVSLTATNASPQAGYVKVLGRAVDAPRPITRLATFGDVPGSGAQPYLRQTFACAVAEAAPLTLAWAPQADKLHPSSKLPIAVTVQRKPNEKRPVRLRLLTSQPTPQKTVKQNNQPKQVDDLNRALRLESETILAADQSDATVNVLVPSDLASQTWNLAIIAELLSADQKRVVSSVAVPSRDFAIESPFTLELTSPPAAQGRAGAGEAGKFSGKLHRASGYALPVVVTLEGLPKEYTAPSVLVAGDKTEFELPLVFPHASPPGELKELKLVALSTPAGLRSTRSNAIPVSVNVASGEKPTVDAPREVFEDSDQFAALLTEGPGQAAIDGGQKYSGAKSLRVTPEQKVNPKLPNLGVAIRENPGPGEYRYLQFAWKKQGGESICLQLNHDGAWGPAPGGRPEASFRYHAGPGGECYGASVPVSQELPGEFVLVTRDLFADFGEFTLTGLAFSPVDGENAYFDHIYLARDRQEFDLAPPKSP